MHTKSWSVNPEETEPLRRPRRRCENSIRINHREIGWEVVDSAHLAHDRDQSLALVNTVINLQFY
jgi:hypothetical protein